MSDVYKYLCAIRLELDDIVENVKQEPVNTVLVAAKDYLDQAIVHININDSGVEEIRKAFRLLQAAHKLYEGPEREAIGDTKRAVAEVGKKSKEEDRLKEEAAQRRAKNEYESFRKQAEFLRKQAERHRKESEQAYDSYRENIFNFSFDDEKYRHYGQYRHDTHHRQYNPNRNESSERYGAGKLSEDEILLGLTPGYSKDDIRPAYIKKMKEAHPDRGGSEELAKRVNAAYCNLT